MILIAKTFAGLEPLLAEEISALGGRQIALLTRGVQFEGDRRLLYRANYELRLALRILVPIASFTASGDNVLYKKVREIDWSQWMDTQNTLAVEAVTFSSNLSHSHFISLRVKDAIVDRFRTDTGRRPDINTEQPDLAIQVHLSKDDWCTISLDSSGHSLHLRGAKSKSSEAPINEVLAAALVRMSGWDMKTPLLDFMCGSGTILTEAAMALCRIPSQIHRKYYSFHHWKDFDTALWQSVVDEASRLIRRKTKLIYGSDISPKAISIAAAHLQEAGLQDIITLQTCPLEKVVPPAAKGWIISNPPYGERLQSGEDSLNALYRQIGDKLKKDFKGWQAWLISSNETAIKHIGLRPSFKTTLYNGPLACKYLGFELFEGKRKEHISGKS